MSSIGRVIARVCGSGREVTARDLPGAVGEAIAREELAGLATMYRVRFVALGCLCVWLLATIPLERSSQYVAALGAFAILGIPPYVLARRGVRQTFVTGVFLTLDAMLLTYFMIIPPPFAVEGWTTQLNLRMPGFLYVGVFLVGVSLCYSPALVLWAGLAMIASWTTGFLWVAALPGSLVTSASQMLDGAYPAQEIIANVLAPNSVNLTQLTNQVVFLALVTGILTFAVWRSRRLVRRQVAAEAERGALSRYFSPNILGDIASAGRDFGQPARQSAAILFVDLVGFTAISERLSPEALVALLRDFHRRFGRTVFAHEGTIDKYVGDCIMAHFGTPHPREDDPLRALRCAAAMLAELERWNAERAAAGLRPLAIGIGLHYGEVLVGNIGDERRLEYTALGDTVNVAERLERLTRDLDVPLVVGDPLIVALRRLGREPGEILPDLCRGEAQLVRGRFAPVEVWVARASPAADSARDRADPTGGPPLR